MTIDNLCAMSMWQRQEDEVLQMRGSAARVRKDRSLHRRRTRTGSHGSRQSMLAKSPVRLGCWRSGRVGDGAARADTLREAVTRFIKLKPDNPLRSP